jgi:hypothetical protein
MGMEVHEEGESGVDFESVGCGHISNLFPQN